MPDERCVFCEIVACRAPAHIVMEDDRSLCLLDSQPFTRGHCLVISKRHVPWWHELSPEENASLFQMAHTVANRMMKRLQPDFVCLYSRGRRIPASGRATSPGGASSAAAGPSPPAGSGPAPPAG